MATPEPRAVPAQTRRPPGPRRLPPLDDLRTLQVSPLAAILKVTAEYGDIVRYPLGPFAVYLLNHPDYTRHVLQDNNRNYDKNTFQYNLLKSVTGEGLLTSDGAFWLRQRRLAQPAFHREKLAALPGLTATLAREMLERWRPYAERGEPLDVAAEMMRLALDVVSRALFSIPMSTEAGPLAEAVLVVLDHIVYRARTMGLAPTFLPTARNRRFRAALHQLDLAVYGIIAQRRQAQQPAADLLALLMAAQDEDGAAGGRRSGMSDRQLRDEVMTLLVAGHETVASALTWTWHLLAQNPDVAGRLHAEAAAAGDLAAPGALTRLSYARMVFEEALRLYPPAWLITRKALADDEIGGYRIPAGALVALCPYAAHRHPAFWPTPERFDPARFSPEAAARRDRFAYFPFGAGPRLCIGNQFALMEAQVVLAEVARVYRLAPASDRIVEMEPSVTLRPREGLWMIPVPVVD
jgi:cytochrome P450